MTTGWPHARGRQLSHFCQLSAVLLSVPFNQAITRSYFRKPITFPKRGLQRALLMDTLCSDDKTDERKANDFSAVYVDNDQRLETLTNLPPSSFLPHSHPARPDMKMMEGHTIHCCCLACVLVFAMSTPIKQTSHEVFRPMCGVG